MRPGLLKKKIESNKKTKTFLRQILCLSPTNSKSKLKVEGW